MKSKAQKTFEKIAFQKEAIDISGLDTILASAASTLGYRAAKAGVKNLGDDWQKALAGTIKDKFKTPKPDGSSKLRDIVRQKVRGLKADTIKQLKNPYIPKYEARALTYDLVGTYPFVGTITRRLVDDGTVRKAADAIKQKGNEQLLKRTRYLDNSNIPPFK